jgi:dephospho-CoA kinase
VNYTKLIIGLTGLYCSGKSTAEKILVNKYHFSIVDVDKIGHMVLEEKKESIISFFGEKIITEGKIDRKKLGLIVFSDKKKLEMLNSITHPLMILKIEEIIRNSNEPKICINAALLFEMNLNRLCSKIIIIKSPIINTFLRARKRDKKSIFKIFKIIISQKVLKLAKQNQTNAEIFYIDNKSNLTNLEKQIDNIFEIDK